MKIVQRFKASTILLSASLLLCSFAHGATQMSESELAVWTALVNLFKQKVNLQEGHIAYIQAQLMQREMQLQAQYVPQATVPSSVTNFAPRKHILNDFGTTFVQAASPTGQLVQQQQLCRPRRRGGRRGRRLQEQARQRHVEATATQQASAGHNVPE